FVGTPMLAKKEYDLRLIIGSEDYKTIIELGVLSINNIVNQAVWDVHVKRKYKDRVDKITKSGWWPRKINNS
ncbi:MAG: hypothetical protein ACQESD_06725, partial [Thermoplasmatota archaeon]